VIQIESVAIRELRGIRTLEISPRRKSFVISGPNGSGKSGVVDAIQFGLTGDISRLSGKGTVGLTVQRHGPHVDKRDDPEAAEVSLSLFVPETGLEDIATLESDPAVLQAVTRRAFVERGLSLVDGPVCPLCDTEWDDVQHLKKHLRAKLAKSKDAEALQQRLLENAAELGNRARQLVALIAAVQAVVKADGPRGFAADLATWSERLNALASLGTIEDVMSHKPELEAGWIAPPASLEDRVSALVESLKAKPDQSASVAAQTFLTLAQDRLTSWKAARRAEKQAATASARGQEVYRAYCDAMEEQLIALYASVEGHFSTYYRDINSDDEGAFKAKLEPSEGKLDLEVAFYDKGMFPPAAYHSEGHQDGMGVCLYLALMKRVLGARFRFSVMDDVVMSVDHGHRKQFCTLLKTHFPDTQFIITTHDNVWAKQMQTGRRSRR